MYLPEFNIQLNIEFLTGDRAQAEHAMCNPAILLGVNLYVFAALFSFGAFWFSVPLLFLAVVTRDAVCAWALLVSVGLWIGSGTLEARLRPWLNQKLEPYQLTL